MRPRGTVFGPMKRSASILALGLVVSGCGMLGGGMPAAGVPGSAGGAAYVTSPAVADTLRRQEKQAFATSNAAADSQEVELEKKAQHALKLALGQEGMTPGLPPPQASSATIAALRGAKMQLRIEPMTNASGAAIADNLVVLKDSFTEKVPALQQKVMAHTATPTEAQELQSGVQYVGKLNDLKMQVSAISMVAMQANVRVQIGGMTDMRLIASMVQSRHERGLEWTEDDWALVVSILGRQRRTQALAASTLGMLAAYEAVVGQNGDPKALDVIAKGTLDSFPLDASASVDDAKAYVQNLAGNAADQKAKYESWLRAAYGDDKYEKQYKANIDRIFDQAGQAGQGRTIAQLQTDTTSRYNADLAKCAKGEPLPPGSLVGPAKCKEAAQGGGAGGATGGGGGVGLGGTIGGLPAGVQGRVDQVQAGMQAAKAIANGDLQGTLDAAASMFPGDGPIQNSLRGVSALTHGDWKGALKAAVSLAPGGGLLKQGLGTATQLLKLF
jgi:hypothetical protein